jgi:hypothetical protein
MGTRTVTLLVGKKRKPFSVHKKLLCTKIKVFKELLSVKQDQLYLPDYQSSYFALLIHWLYRDEVPGGDTQAHITNLHHLYFVAEKFGIEDLINKTMDGIQDECQKYALFVPADIIRLVYEKPSAPGGLKKFVLDLAIYQSFESAKCKTEGETDKIHVLDKAAIKEIWDIGSVEYYTDFWDSFQKWSLSNPPSDPRIRDPLDRCLYHCHSSEDCQSIRPETLPSRLVLRPSEDEDDEADDSDASVESFDPISVDTPKNGGVANGLTKRAADGSAKRRVTGSFAPFQLQST